MIQEIIANGKDYFKKALGFLKGSDKRIIAASLAQAYGYGGKSYVAREYNIGRDTIRLGMNELRTGIRSEDAFNMRGRKSIDFYLTKIKDDIREIVDSQSQTDPKFDSNRLYTRLTTKEIRNQLIKQKQYSDEELPTNQTINNLINDLGYKMRKVQKVKPLKKLKKQMQFLKKSKK